MRRNSPRCTLPVVVIGRASMKTISRGYSCAASRVFTESWICAANSWSASKPVANTTKALMILPRNASGEPMTAACATAVADFLRSPVSLAHDLWDRFEGARKLSAAAARGRVHRRLYGRVARAWVRRLADASTAVTTTAARRERGDSGHQEKL